MFTGFLQCYKKLKGLLKTKQKSNNYTCKQPLIMSYEVFENTQDNFGELYQPIPT